MKVCVLLVVAVFSALSSLALPDKKSMKCKVKHASVKRVDRDIYRVRCKKGYHIWDEASPKQRRSAKVNCQKVPKCVRDTYNIQSDDSSASLVEPKESWRPYGNDVVGHEEQDIVLLDNDVAEEENGIYETSGQKEILGQDYDNDNLEYDYQGEYDGGEEYVGEEVEGDNDYGQYYVYDYEGRNETDYQGAVIDQDYDAGDDGENAGEDYPDAGDDVTDVSGGEQLNEVSVGNELPERGSIGQEEDHEDSSHRPTAANATDREGHGVEEDNEDHHRSGDEEEPPEGRSHHPTSGNERSREDYDEEEEDQADQAGEEEQQVEYDGGEEGEGEEYDGGEEGEGEEYEGGEEEEEEYEGGEEEDGEEYEVGEEEEGEEYGGGEEEEGEEYGGGEEEEGEEYEVGEEEEGEEYEVGEEEEGEEYEGGEEEEGEEYEGGEEGEEQEYEDYEDVDEEADPDYEEEQLYRRYEILSDFYKKHFVDLRVLDTSCNPEKTPPPDVSNGFVKEYR